MKIRKVKNAPHPFVRMKSVEPNEDESEKDVTLIHYLSLVDSTYWWFNTSQSAMEEYL